MLKVDLHLHTKEDNYDNLNYSAKELIDRAAELKFDVIAITLHNEIFFSKAVISYAEQKGILLIPGVELSIEKKHVLLYNVSEDELKKLKKLDDLEKIKNEDNLIIAAHPYYFGSSCLGKKLDKYFRFFDAIEYAHFYYKIFNPTKKAIITSRKFHKPLIGNSDSHNLYQFGSTYSLVDSKKDIESIVKAIKKGKVEVVSNPLSFSLFLKILFFNLNPKKIFKRLIFFN